MGDVSVLSHEYKTASDLSQALNDALIVLKRTHWSLPGATDISAEALGSARVTLANLVGALAQLLRASTGDQSAQQVPSGTQVSGGLVSRLREEHTGDLAYFLDDLSTLGAKLSERSASLTDADLALLDELATAADAETSNVFRRLMRK